MASAVIFRPSSRNVLDSGADSDSMRTHLDILQNPDPMAASLLLRDTRGQGHWEEPRGPVHRCR